MLKNIINFNSQNSYFAIGTLLISFFPISLLIGSFIINLNILLIILFFFFSYYFHLNETDINKNFLYLILIFFISIILNIFFNTGENFGYAKQLGFIRFAIMTLAISYFIKFKYFNFVLSVWTFLFFIVTFDIFFEFTFGFNIFGNSSYMPGRLASFLGDELKIGGYYYGFITLITAHILNKSKNTSLTYLIILFFILAGIFIGERANLIKIAFSLSFFFLLYKKINLKIKIIFLLCILSTLTLTIFLNSNYKIRFYDQFIKNIINQGVTSYIIKSQYGSHYQTAYEIFKKNKIFGIGIKQFRYESAKDEYDNKILNPQKNDNWATHPHQTHFEFLAETGLFGYITFILFMLISIITSIKNYIINNNIYLLASLSFLISYFIPIVPSGSFFSTFNASIFWINYSILVLTQNYSFNVKGSKC